jgi:hypothetical protein
MLNKYSANQARVGGQGEAVLQQTFTTHKSSTRNDNVLKIDQMHKIDHLNNPEHMLKKVPIEGLLREKIESILEMMTEALTQTLQELKKLKASTVGTP